MGIFNEYLCHTSLLALLKHSDFPPLIFVYSLFLNPWDYTSLASLCLLFAVPVEKDCV